MKHTIIQFAIQSTSSFLRSRDVELVTRVNPVWIHSDFGVVVVKLIHRESEAPGNRAERVALLDLVELGLPFAVGDHKRACCHGEGGTQDGAQRAALLLALSGLRLDL